MKSICKFCKSFKHVEQKLKDLAREIQKIEKKPILNIDKKKKIFELPGSSVLNESSGIESMTFKDTVPKKVAANIDYIKCYNPKHLIDSNVGVGKKFVVHKYYFTCPHFEEAN